MENTRIFVGNLKSSIELKDIEKKFKAYGDVSNIDIKDKLDFEGNVISKFAYVNLNTNKSSVDKCVHECNGSNWKGSILKVDVAKESFLQKLQRERELNKLGKPASDTKDQSEKSYNFNFSSFEKHPPKNTYDSTQYETEDVNLEYDQNYESPYIEQEAEVEKLPRNDDRPKNKFRNQSRSRLMATKFTTPLPQINRYDPGLSETRLTKSSNTLKRDQENVLENEVGNKFAKLAEDIAFGNDSSSFTFLSKFSNEPTKKKDSQEMSNDIDVLHEPMSQKTGHKRQPFFRKNVDPSFVAGRNWILTPLNEEYEKEFKDVRQDIRQLCHTRNKRVMQKQKNRNFVEKKRGMNKMET